MTQSRTKSTGVGQAQTNRAGGMEKATPSTAA